MGAKADAKTLGDYFTLQRGTTYKSRLLGQPGPVLLGLATIERNGGFRRDSLKTYGGECPDKLLVRPGELYVSLKDVTQAGDLLGAVARLPRDHEPGRLTQDTVKLEPTSDDAPLDYLYWLMRTPQYRTHCRAHATGTTNLGLAREDFLAFPAPEPTEAQHLIVDALGALDDKIELNRKMNRTLEDMAQTIFQSWLAALDDHAALVRHAQDIIDAGVLEVGDGYRAKRSELDNEGMPFARAGNIDNGFQFEGAEFLGVEGIEQARAQRKLSQPHDVVFTSKGTVGRFAFVTEDVPHFVYSPQLCYWRSLQVDELDPYFLFYWMRSPAFLQQVAAVKGQTDMADYVSLRDQRRMKVLVPPPREQTVLVERLKPLVEKVALNVQESRTLAELRDTLLPRLISGELRVPAAERVVEQAL